jgi:hypothetical protein
LPTSAPQARHRLSAVDQFVALDAVLGQILAT